MLNGDCLMYCPSKYYSDSVSGKCLACHKTCETCSNGTNKDCLKCISSLDFDIVNKVCSSKCTLTTQYYDLTTITCKDCYSTCLTCFDGTSQGCLTCSTGKVL